MERPEDTLSPEQMADIRRLMERMLSLNVCAVYGVEEEGEPEAQISCSERLHECKARCCMMVFALTKAEVSAGQIRHDTSRPFFIAHGPDGYCDHMDRATLGCAIWADRPLRCRRYDCRQDGGA